MNRKVFKERPLILLLIVLLPLFSNCKHQSEKEERANDSINIFLGNYDYYLSDTLDIAFLKEVQATILNLPNSKENRLTLKRFVQKTRAEKTFSYQLLNYAKEAKDSVDIADAYMLLGRYFSNRYNVDSSYYYYSKAENYFLMRKDSLNLEEVYLHKAELLTGNSVFGEAENQMTKAIGFGLSNRDVKRLFQQSCIMGEILVGLEQEEEALKLYEEALKIMESKDFLLSTTEYYRRLNKANIYNNISRVYIKQKKYDLAITYLRESIENYIDFGNSIDLQLYASLSLNLAVAKLMNGDLSEVHNLLLSSIEISNKYQNYVLENIAKLRLAEYNYLSNKPKSAHGIVNEVLDYTEKTEDLQLKMKAISLLMLYEEENAPDNFIEYMDLSRYVVDKNNLIRNKFTRIKYEANALEKSNHLLKHEKNVVSLLSFILLFLALSGLLILYYRQRARKLTLVKMLQGDTEKYYNSIINSHNDLSIAQERERNEIAKELHDGVLNKLFVTRFSLMQLERENFEVQKDLLVREVKDVENYLRGVSQALANEESMLIESFSQLIKELVFVQNRNHAISFSLSIKNDIDVECLSHHTKINIYRILQEVLQNVQKHSEASLCKVIIKRSSTATFEIQINDNGCGFDTRIVERGRGLVNVKERAELIGGKLKIISKKGLGTMITLFIQTK